MITRLASALVVALMSVTVLSGAAQAQAPAPVGVWKSKSGGTLIVTGSGAQYRIKGRPLVTGSWTWDFRTTTGGALTIHYINAGRFHNKIYFNISWVNRNTILIWGEPFMRR
jgi:hypothetical protein